MSAVMRTHRLAFAALPLVLVLGPAAVAAPHKDAPSHVSHSPKKLGDFNDWTAATYDQAGHTMCYAFTRAQASPADPGHHRAILTVTERPTFRDSVAIEAGFDFAPKAAVKMDVGHTSLDFYTAHSTAYARDDRAAVRAFERGANAVAHLPVPHGKMVSETFSLNGFSAAHDAILKACSGK